MYRRDRIKITALQTGDISVWRNFKKLRNEVNNAIKNVKKSYCYKTFETCKTWETINEVTRARKSNKAINELELNEMRITNSTEMKSQRVLINFSAIAEYPCVGVL